MSETIKSPSQSHYKSYLEELNDNVNYNNIDSVINIDRLNVMDNCKKRILCKVQNKNEVKKLKEGHWRKIWLTHYSTIWKNIKQPNHAKELILKLMLLHFILMEMMASVFLATDFGRIQVTVKTTEGMTWKELLEYERKIEVTERQIKDGYDRIKSKVK